MNYFYNILKIFLFVDCRLVEKTWKKLSKNCTSLQRSSWKSDIPDSPGFNAGWKHERKAVWTHRQRWKQGHHTAPPYPSEWQTICKENQGIRSTFRTVTRSSRRNIWRGGWKISEIDNRCSNSWAQVGWRDTMHLRGKRQSENVQGSKCTSTYNWRMWNVHGTRVFRSSGVFQGH